MNRELRSTDSNRHDLPFHFLDGFQDAEESFRQIVNSIQRHRSLELKLFLTRVLAEAAKLFPGPAISTPTIPKRLTPERKRDRSKS
jgi:hypothetical protein